MLTVAVLGAGLWVAAGQDVKPMGPPPEGLPCEVRSFGLNRFVPELDGQWQGMLAASDGNVYFASSTHSGERGAAVFRYWPKTDTLELLCEDITLVCNEDPQVSPQGKIHSAFVEHDGWIYFATHYSSEKPGAASAYTGGHVVGLEMAGGMFRDLGVIHPGYTIYSGLGVDAARNRLYVQVTPLSDAQASLPGAGTRIYALDLARGTKQDLGVLSERSHDHAFWFFVDRRGDCWFTLGSEGTTLFCVRGDTLQVERFPGVLALEPGVRGWGWAVGLPDGDRCVFVLGGGQTLWRFDATRIADPAQAFTALGTLGPTGLGIALGGDRVFYVQRADRQVGHKASDHHLLSIGLDTGVVQDHGWIVDPEGRRPWRVEGMTADTAGRVYFSGDWYMLEGENGTRRYSGFDGHRAVYKPFRRGQIFAVWQPGAS